MKWPWQRREAKASRAQKLLRLISPGEARFMERRPETFAREGYRQNAVVFACVSMIARAVGTMPLKLRAGGRDMDTHPLLDLLARPNPTQSGADLLEALVSDLLISGNSYLERVRSGGAAGSELWRQEPAKMRVVPGELGVPAGFELSDQGQKVRWEADPIRGQSDILQVKTFNPLDVWYRSAAYNSSIGGADNSAHLTGHAVDTAISGERAFRLVKLAFAHGFTGVGPKQSGPRETRFIHLDDLAHDLRPRIWTY